MLDHALQLRRALDRARREPPKKRSALAPYFAAIYESTEVYHSPSPSPEPSSPRTSNTSETSIASHTVKSRQNRKTKRSSPVIRARVSKAYRQKSRSPISDSDSDNSRGFVIMPRCDSIESCNSLDGYHSVDSDASLSSDDGLDSYYKGRYRLRRTKERKRRASREKAYCAT